MEIIGAWEIIDHGIENSQYFQGCGTSFTRFENVVTGIGADFAEAFDDCLENMAQQGAETANLEPLAQFELKVKRWPARPRVTSKHGDDTYYHVSIRWNLAKEFAEVNLDAMAADELTEYANGDGPAPLRFYAAIKTQAMAARESGKIPRALDLEQTCDALYKALPDSLRTW